MAFLPSSRGRLTDKDLGRFPGDTLFDRLARTVCHAGCLPRKELFEAWEMARRVRRLLRGGRIVDLGGGHGLLAQIMLILDDSSPSALVVDKALPASSARVYEALVQRWPRLSERITFVTRALDEVEILPTDVVVSSHACGRLTDVVLDSAIAARSRLTSCARYVSRSRAIASGHRASPPRSHRRTACCSARRPFVPHALDVCADVKQTVRIVADSNRRDHRVLSVPGRREENRRLGAKNHR